MKIGLLSAFLILLLGCGDPTRLYTPDYQLVLAPGGVILAPGDSFQMAAVLYLPSGDALPGYYDRLYSTDVTIFTVSSNRVIRSTGKAGTAELVVVAHNLETRATVHVLPVLSPTMHVTLPSGAPSPWAVAAHGSLVLLTGISGDASGGTVWKAMLPTLSLSHLFDGGLASAFAFSSNFDRIYIADGVANGFRAVTLANDSLIDGPSRLLPDRALGIVLASHDSTLYAVAGDEGLYAVPADSMNRYTLLHVFPAIPLAITAHPTAPLLYASAGDQVQELAIPTGSLVRVLPLGGSIRTTAVSSDGARLYAADEQGGLVIWDLAANQPIAIHRFQGSGSGLALSPDGQRLFVGSINPSRIYAFDIAQGAFTAMYTVGGVPRGIAFTTDGQSVLVANSAGWLDLLQ